MQRRILSWVAAWAVLGAALGFLVPTDGRAGTTGKLMGVVRDAQTGEGLANANVVIMGTALGAASRGEGEFFILNVPGGTYDVKASFMGFKEVVLTGVKVAPDFTTEVEFDLEATTLQLVDPVQVAAKRPLIQRDRTGTARFITGEDIQNQPIRGYQDAASLQAGVVTRGGVLQAPGGTRLEEATNDPRLYIRGGRSNEVAYFVDGFSQQDPLTGISTTSINQNAIDQIVVMTGGFDAEYGRIMSGLVNVVTKEGGSEYYGSVDLVTDNLAGDWIGAKSYDTNIYDVAFGGPVPGLENMSFYASGQRRWSRDRSPRPVEETNVADILSGISTLQTEYDSVLFKDGRLPGNSLSGWTWQGKLSWTLNEDMKVKVGTLGSVDKWQEFRQTYLFDVDHTPRYEDSNESIFATFTHTVNPNMFYELGLSWFYTERFRGDGVHFRDIEAYGRRLGNPDFDSGVPLFVYGDTTNGESLWDDYLHRESSYIGMKGDLTHLWHPNNTGKVGIEFRRHTLRRYQSFFPVNVYKYFEDGDSTGFVDVDRYGYDLFDPEKHADDGLNGAKNPVDVGIYLQNKYEVGDFVLRAGLRYDYLSPETPRLLDEALPLGEDRTALDDDEDLTDSEAYNKLSPRIGVGFPVGERALFHANYGKFFQQPNLENLYVDYNYLAHKVRTGGYFVAFGNPNLVPEETTAYEMGFTRQVGPTATLDVTAFYKDVSNLTQVFNISASPNSYASFRNLDYATIKGIDMTLDIRRSNNVAGSVYYTVSWAKGTGSNPNSQRNIAWTANEPPKQTFPVDFDQRHKITFNADWRLEEGAGPQLGGMRPLERSGINVVVNLASGFPYTPTRAYDAVTLGAVSPQPFGSNNSRNAPWNVRVDLKANKGFNLGGLELSAYIWILNLFDRENVITVYDTSGDAFSTGWLATSSGAASYASEEAQGLYDLRQNDPTLLDVPRLVRFGLRTSF